MIKFISFDLDDTLWPIMPMILQAEERLQQWLAAEVPGYAERIDRDLLGKFRDGALAADADLQFDISRLRIRCIELALAHCYSGQSRTVDDAAINQQALAAFEIFMQGRNRVSFFPGALDVLTELKRSFKLCGLTNGNADIQRTGLDKYFEFCMSPATARARKPDPAIFTATLAQADCTNAQIIHVGDHPEEDIGGAAAAGWRCIWVQQPGITTQAPATTKANATISDLSELPTVIARLAD